MKRDIENAKTLLTLSQKDNLLKKQVDDTFKLAPKEGAQAAVRLGRMRGLYFSEHDWNETVSNRFPQKKAA